MFVSFFPRPKLLFASFCVWSLLGILFWYFAAQSWGPTFSLGNLIGYGMPAPLAADADNSARALFEAQASAAQTFYVTNNGSAAATVISEIVAMAGLMYGLRSALRPTATP